jgi:hypothetical protein
MRAKMLYFRAIPDRGKFSQSPDEEGVIRSQTFPSLWLDIEALPENDMAKVLAVIQQGLASSFFAQDTPPINASFWVERNAPPLSHVKHLSYVQHL